MYLKATGAIIIGISSFFAGKTLYEEERKRVSELKKTVLFFQKLKEYTSDNYNISEAIEKSAQNTDFCIKKSAICFADNISKDKNAEFKDIWNISKGEIYPLKKEDMQVIEMFFTSGKRHTEFQVINEADNILQSLNSIIEKAEKDLPDRKKLYINSSVCIGILTVIMLI